MDSEEELAILQQGVQAWNQWRKKNPHITIDLIQANLMVANLSGAVKVCVVSSSTCLYQ